MEKGDIDDVPTGNCDIPDICAVLSVVVWKIRACEESALISKTIFLRGTN